MEAQAPYTLNALKRWSCINSTLPPMHQIKEIHVYDFDNTLFRSPLPNPSIWEQGQIGKLANPDVFANGGWWHDVSILEATGDGVEIEEPRAWKDWWVEDVVDLARLSMQHPEALTVLLTGRSEASFQDIIGRMVKSKGLEFDLSALKPAVGPNNESFRSTMAFKQAFLTTLLHTYRDASKIIIYEDRAKHITEFRDWVIQYNEELAATANRSQVQGEVKEVIQADTYLDPVTEITAIQRAINAHNLAILNEATSKKFLPMAMNKRILYTTYKLTHKEDIELLRSLVPPDATLDKKTGPARLLANLIMISLFPASHQILNKIGGLGAKVLFEVQEIGMLDNKIWAARVAAVDKSVNIWHVDGPRRPPTVVLAVRPNIKPAEVRNITNWTKLPDEKIFRFRTVIEHEFRLSIDAEQDPRAGSAQSTTVPNTQSQNHGPNDYYPSQPPPLNPYANRGHKPAPSNHASRGPPQHQRHFNDSPNRPPSGPSFQPRRGNPRPGERRDFHNRPTGPGAGRGGGGGGRGHHHQQPHHPYRGGGRGGRGGGGGGAGGQQQQPAGGQAGYRDYDAAQTRDGARDRGVADAY
jgi:Swiss Army Knife RNA repair-like protein